MKTGPLWKKGNTGKWDKRYFKLSKDSFMYFKSLASTAPKKVILCTDLLRIVPSEDTRTFSVVMKQKTSYLRAINAKDCLEWIHELTLAIEDNINGFVLQGNLIDRCTY